LTLPLNRIELAASKLIVRTPSETIEVPLGGSVAQQSDGRISISVQLDQERILVIGGTLDGSNLTFAGAADPGRTLLTVRSIWPDAKVGVDGRLKLSGEASWGEHPLIAEAKIEVLPSPTTAASVVSDDKLRITSGVFHVSADLGNAIPWRLRGSDAGFVMKQQNVTADGANGEVDFVSLSPLKTPPGQKLTAGKLKIGEMELTGGTLEFAMRASDTIHVQHTDWTWLGGRAWADDFDIIAGQPVAITVHMRDVELKELLAAFAKDKASGDGKISGDIPVVVVSGSDVRFGNGNVTASRGGKVQISDMAAILPTAEAAAQAASGASSEQVKKNVIEALSDFQYDTLSARLVNEPRGLVTHVQMRGRGRSGNRQPLFYELNLTGLEKPLKVYLKLSDVLSAAATRPMSSTRKAEAK
jgi:hypothetical protein